MFVVTIIRVDDGMFDQTWSHKLMSLEDLLIQVFKHKESGNTSFILAKVERTVNLNIKEPLKFDIDNLKYYISKT